MANRKEDRRVQRTRQLLENALIDLTVEKGYAKVTVQDIVDRANVGRTTFYAHFQDKEELLTRSIEGFFDWLHQELEQPTRGESSLLPALTIFRHVAGYAHVFKAFGATQMLRDQFHQQLVTLMEQRLEVLETAGQPVDVPHQVLANYCAGGLLALLVWWLEGKTPYSAEDMAGMFQRMVSATISRGEVRG
jgi:AcrR family transcriptional regulator